MTMKFTLFIKLKNRDFSCIQTLSVFIVQMIINVVYVMLVNVTMPALVGTEIS